MLVVGLLSCEKVYLPNLDSQETILTFEGLLTDQPGFHSVKISKSVGYNDNMNFEKGTGFQVLIEDSEGTQIPLTESKTQGHYITSDQAKGLPHHSYRMVATDPEGFTYTSAYETLMPTAPIDSISAEYYVHSWLEKNDAGYLEQTEEGVRFFNYTASYRYIPYYRYEYDVVFQSAQIYPTQPFKTFCYIARPVNSYSKGFVALANGNLFNNQFIQHNPIDFISKSQSELKIDLDSIELDSLGMPIFSEEEIKLYGFGYLLRIKQYSLSESGFRFWDAINKQVTASGQLFDPIESQIEGNITCISDSTRQTFGYFGVSSVTSKSSFIYLRQNHEVHVQPNVYFPELQKNVSSITPFDFWIF